MDTSTPNLVKISQIVADLWRFSFFKCRPAAILDFVVAQKWHSPCEPVICSGFTKDDFTTQVVDRVSHRTMVEMPFTWPLQQGVICNCQSTFCPFGLDAPATTGSMQPQASLICPSVTLCIITLMWPCVQPIISLWPIIIYLLHCSSLVCNSVHWTLASFVTCFCYTQSTQCPADLRMVSYIHLSCDCSNDNCHSVILL